MSALKYDVVVSGASSFVGQLLATYLDELRRALVDRRRIGRHGGEHDQHHQRGGGRHFARPPSKWPDDRPHRRLLDPGRKVR